MSRNEEIDVRAKMTVENFPDYAYVNGEIIETEH